MASLGAIHLSKHTGAKHTATVIFFHGSGGNGAEMKEWVSVMSKGFTFPHIKVMYPTAPLQPYTPMDGEMSNVWFDRKDISPFVPETSGSLMKIKTEVMNLIRKENEAGIPTNRIIVGGFSMGGALALHTAYRWERDVAGAFAFSSFLNEESAVYEELKSKPAEKLAPLLQLHGNSDNLVPQKWGETTFNELKSLGVQGEFHIIDRLEHLINRKGISIIKNWIEKILPEISE